MSEENGVWVVYFWDVQPIISKIFAYEIEALRAAVFEHNEVCFVSFGESFSEVIAEQGRINREDALAQREAVALANREANVLH